MMNMIQIVVYETYDNDGDSDRSDIRSFILEGKIAVEASKSGHVDRPPIVWFTERIGIVCLSRESPFAVNK
jgi:hypothetical protein